MGFGVLCDSSFRCWTGACMRQDYPKALPADAKVGFTVVNQVSITNVKPFQGRRLHSGQPGEPHAAFVDFGEWVGSFGSVTAGLDAGLERA
jgi:hypothetical protein